MRAVALDVKSVLMKAIAKIGLVSLAVGVAIGGSLPVKADQPVDYWSVRGLTRPGAWFQKYNTEKPAAHCPNICPTTLSDLAKVYRALPVADRNKVQILFITVDPRRDRPEVLKNYVPYFDTSFVGLTGSDDQVAETAKAYGAFYEAVRNPGDSPDVYSVNHSTYTYLITADGKWKLLYDFDQLRDTEKMVADIERVLVGS